MPSLQLPRHIISRSTPRIAHVSRGSATNTSGTLPWIIVAAVAAVLALGSCTALVYVTLSKRRLLKQQLEEARLRDPCLHPKEFSRRRRLTVADQRLEAEEQREAMIRKSLASRGSSRSPSTSSRVTLDRRASMIERPRTGSVWGAEKDLDLQLLRTRSAVSLRRMRSTSPFPELPQPTLSRNSSFSRPLLHDMPTEPPPLLEQHPCLRAEGNSMVHDRPGST